MPNPPTKAKSPANSDPICDDNLPFRPGDRVTVNPLPGGRGGDGVLKLVRGFGSMAMAEIIRDEDGLRLCVPLDTVTLR